MAGSRGAWWNEMQLLGVVAISVPFILLGLAFFFDYKGVATFFVKDGGRETRRVIKLLGVFFVVAPGYMVISELIRLG
ncbi:MULTISPECIES: hypothetical protein [unclassified Streptomyces]|uniref:hypothetical protein n=1 Tax=unclassified Streptomyces TaxID=2593676 RepID=UPI00278C0292|nr:MULTISPECIES: hypothetical protein [unclassified Streptomyces]